MLIAFSVAPSGRPATADSGVKPHNSVASANTSSASSNPDYPNPSPSNPAPSNPAADDASVHAAVAEAVSIVRASGLPHRTDAMFTTIEGDWDECLAVVKQCCEAMQKYGSRVSLVMKADIRPGYVGELTGKLERLEAAIEARG